MRYEGTVYRPPSEARSLIVQTTIGCSHNRCTFCTMYKDKKFRLRPIEEIKADFDEAREVYGGRVRRIFLADGDALVRKTPELLEILTYAKQCFPDVERISSYGSPADINRKTSAELSELREAGLELIYMGAESGDDIILKNVCKGVTSEEMIAAGEKLRECCIKNSTTLISGLGGTERLREHAVSSARLISAIKPEYVGFLTLMLDDRAPIMEEIKAKRMTLLTPPDVVEEMRLFLSHVDSEGTVFRSNHASNYIMLRGTLNGDIPAMLASLDEAKRQDRYRSEKSRLL
ncbi:MAG: radical SAM protein [Lachnospiraceae bacterium]|nr:radical SAM protein [Lachnospiraceae bacterium]